MPAPRRAPGVQLDAGCGAARHGRLELRRRGRRAERGHQTIEIERRGGSFGGVAPRLRRHALRCQRHPLGRRQQFLVRLLEREPARRPRLRDANLPRELLDDFFDLGVVPRQRERALVIREGLGGLAVAVIDLREAAHRGQVLGGFGDHELELAARVGELAQVEQRAAEGHPRRQIAGVTHQPLAADADGFVRLPRAAVLLRELREGDRRRVVLDPAPEFIDTGR